MPESAFTDSATSANTITIALQTLPRTILRREPGSCAQAAQFAGQSCMHVNLSFAPQPESGAHDMARFAGIVKRANIHNGMACI
jgi:hypothetical protein